MTEEGVRLGDGQEVPEACKPFAPVSYFWSDRYDLKIQAYGYLPGHDELAVVDGDLTDSRLALAVGMPPRVIRRWRQAVAAGASWGEVVG
ncbi:oxidoreductase C-terminal domain-containing protein [Streptomyces sp. NPDC058755]|uniref:oxidoreductase C-terminal domain-containing protein n=1 Tax=Streptomyces sp. NPDC058755 TaxID=3346624 RepID=UPI00369401BF